MASTRIQRTGEPPRMRALGDGGAVYQVPLNAPPDRLWRSLFLEQKEYELDSVPALVRFTYHPPAANFGSDERELRKRLRLLDTWIEEANRRCGFPAHRRDDEQEGRGTKPGQPPEV